MAHRRTQGARRLQRRHRPARGGGAPPRPGGLFGPMPAAAVFGGADPDPATRRAPPPDALRTRGRAGAGPAPGSDGAARLRVGRPASPSAARWRCWPTPWAPRVPARHRRHRGARGRRRAGLPDSTRCSPSCCAPAGSTAWPGSCSGRGPTAATARVDTVVERLAGLGVPLMSGLPFGHGSPQLTVPLGVEAELDADRRDAHLPGAGAGLNVRSARSGRYDDHAGRDRAAVYEICLRTGDGGHDAGPRWARSPHDLMGDVWAGPYLAVEPATRFGGRGRRRRRRLCARDDRHPPLRGRVRAGVVARPARGSHPAPAGPPASWTLDGPAAPPGAPARCVRRTTS